jgi:PAS domain S-box-containing protein
MEDLTGLTAAQVLGKKALNLLPHLVEQGIDVLLRKALQGETVHSPDMPFFINNTGKKGWASAVVGPHRDYKGNITGVIAVVKNITNRKIIEADLKAASELTDKRVREQTSELHPKNEGLINVVKERRSVERQFRDTAELLPQVVFEADEKANITWVSHRGFDFFGYRPEDLSKEFSVLDAVIPEDRDKCINDFRRSLQGEDLSGSTYTAVRKDGSTFPIIVYFNPIIIEGKPIGTRGIIVDITEHQKTVDALIESERKYRDLFENANDIIYINDFSGRILSCNTAALKIFGYSSGEGDININQIVDQKYLSYVQGVMNEKAKGKVNVSNYEVLAHAKNGKPVWLELNTRTVMENGIPVLVQGIARDITERKQAEETLKNREKQLEEKTQNLEEMNSALKILLKRRDEDKKELEERYLVNIKQLILPYIEKLKQETLNPSAQTYLSVIESNMDDLLSPFMQKLMMKYPHLTPKEVQVAHLIKDGMTTKEIANILKVTKKAIDFHRDSIRKKLGLNNTKTNLISFLNSKT